MAASSGKGVIVVNRDDILSSGSEGVQVFSGKFDHVPVAVKRIVKGKDTSRLEQEVKYLKENPHEHIVKYYGHASDDSFFYIAMEMCAGTLEDVVSGAYNGPPPGDSKVILHQITKGLAFLHSKAIVHRDLKPRNILISQPDSPSSPPKMKLADFGISKQQTREYYYSNTGSYGTVGWAAPELLKETNDRFKLSVDIFSLGCIFGYVLTGHHPFGDVLMRSANIVEYKLSWTGKEKLKDRKMKELVKRMIAQDPNKRPDINEVLNRFPQSTRPKVTITPDQNKPSTSSRTPKAAGDVKNVKAPASPSPAPASYVTRQNSNPNAFKQPASVATPGNRMSDNFLSPTSPASFPYSPAFSRGLSNSPSSSKPSTPQPSAANRSRTPSASSPGFLYTEEWSQPKRLVDLHETAAAPLPPFQRSTKYSSFRETFGNRMHPSPVPNRNSPGANASFERGTPLSSSLRASSTATRQLSTSPASPSVSSLIQRFQTDSSSAGGRNDAPMTRKK